MDASKCYVLLGKLTWAKAPSIMSEILELLSFFSRRSSMLLINSLAENLQILLLRGLRLLGEELPPLRHELLDELQSFS